MADLYHSAATQVLSSGAAVAITHNLVADGSPVAPRQVVATFEHGASIGANAVRVTHKGTDVFSVVLDQEIDPGGAPNAVTCRLDAIYWNSDFGDS